MFVEDRGWPEIVLEPTGNTFQFFLALPAGTVVCARPACRWMPQCAPTACCEKLWRYRRKDERVRRARPQLVASNRGKHPVPAEHTAVQVQPASYRRQG